MTEPFEVNPQDVENAKRASRTIVAMVFDHFQHCLEVGFDPVQAFTLARDWHRIQVGGQGEERD